VRRGLWEKGERGAQSLLGRGISAEVEGYRTDGTSKCFESIWHRVEGFARGYHVAVAVSPIEIRIPI
jgi:hypothetical protein